MYTVGETYQVVGSITGEVMPGDYRIVAIGADCIVAERRYADSPTRYFEFDFDGHLRDNPNFRLCKIISAWYLPPFSGA